MKELFRKKAFVIIPVIIMVLTAVILTVILSSRSHGNADSKVTDSDGDMETSDYENTGTYEKQTGAGKEDVWDEAVKATSEISAETDNLESSEMDNDTKSPETDAPTDDTYISEYITDNAETLSVQEFQTGGTVLRTVPYEVILHRVSSWETEGSNFAQYECSVHNTGIYTLNEWMFSGDMGDGSNISSSWNCDAHITKGILTINPLEWNRTVRPGETLNACGLIMCGPSLPESIIFKSSGSEEFIISNETEAETAIETGSEAASSGSQPDKDNVTTGNDKPYTPPENDNGSPYDEHGKLTLNGTMLTDSHGNSFQLKGISTHGLQWFPQYVTKDTFKYFRDNWGANMIRLAMYTAEGGFCEGNSTALEKIIDNGVGACSELGMYVIIDWHILSDGNPNIHIDDAKAFFARMAYRYSGYGNVIYEICNEPNGVSWSEIKRYADEVIPVIRSYDKDAIIICGTPTWSQDVDQPLANPLNEENRHNVMYALHFYAATHGQYLRDKVKLALSQGTPVFISEFSICDASGNGGIDYNSADEWKKLIDEYNLSYAGWSLSNKQETSALIKNGVDKTSDFSTEDLSDTGIWLRDLIASGRS